MKSINYNLLVQAEKIRYQSDFSSAHWLHQMISNYSEMKPSKLRDAYETVLRIAIKFGVKKALEKANEFKKVSGFPGFPMYVHLSDNDEWNQTKDFITKNWELHLKNRFGYFRQGD